MVFAAPMSVLARDQVKIQNECSDDLLAKVGKNHVNFVYGPDVVPRGYAHVGYIEEVLKEVAIEDTFGLIKIASRWLQNITKLVNTEFVPVAKKYRHVGKLVHYYKDTEANDKGPIQLVDTGPGKSDSPSDFGHYSYSLYEESKDNGNNINALLKAHGYFPTAFVSYLSKEWKELDDELKVSAKFAEEQYQKKRKREET